MTERTEDVHAALFEATPPRARGSFAARMGVGWWGSREAAIADCDCCDRRTYCYQGYNGGAHTRVLACGRCTSAGHEGC